MDRLSPKEGLSRAGRQGRAELACGRVGGIEWHEGHPGQPGGQEDELIA